jgi:aspartate/methionine/tyrosine aminotransferase
MEYPELMESARDAFAPDAIERAQRYLAIEKRGTGPYSHSQGIAAVRQEIADFINQRDGTSDANADHIFLTNGASAGVDLLMRSFIRGANDGVCAGWQCVIERLSGC